MLGGVRGLLITLVVLAVLLVGADFVARAVAEDRVGAALQEPLGLATEPEVDVHGFPFLTQALAGRYDDVDLTTSGVGVGELRDLTLNARLQDVALPLDALLAGRVDAIPAGTVTAEARVSPTDLARLLDVGEVGVEPVTAEEVERLAAEAEADDSGLSGSAAALRRVDPDSSVRLTSTIQVAGRAVPVAVIASFRLSGNRVTLSARDIRTTEASGASGASGAEARVAAAALRSRLGTYSRTVDPGQLPFGIRATEMRAEQGLLVVSGTARDVDLLG